MADLTILSALAGGTAIGAASALLLIKHKRAAGISGIAAGILPPWDSESRWRLCFLAGLFLSAPLYRLLGLQIPIRIETPLSVLAIVGLLVGYGARLGGGCTSGHGICGIARLSIRSLVATMIFILSAGIMVFLVRHLL